MEVEAIKPRFFPYRSEMLHYPACTDFFTHRIYKHLLSRTIENKKAN